MAKKHPRQKMRVDEHGTVRFVQNDIVEFLAMNKLNDLARMGFSDEDWRQLAQLIGYSVSGYGELSYVPHQHALKMDRKAERILAAHRAAEPDA